MDKLTVRLQGDSALPNLPPVRWNKADVDARLEELVCCIWTCWHKPELNTYGPKEGPENDR